MTILDEALKYSQKGLSVIPIAKDKTPLVPWKEYQERRATEDEIKQWWVKSPNANVGIVTGKISGITVLDCDSTEAIEAFQSIYKGYTVTAQTPRGVHYYFQYKEGTRNTVKIKGIDLDLRSEGGYVVAPPSISSDGLPYSFIHGMDVPFDSLESLYFDFLYKGDVDTHKNDVHKSLQCLQTSTNPFAKGSRDNSLYLVAQALIDGHCKTDLIPQVLEILCKNCDPPFDLSEIPVKIQSAMTHAKQRVGKLSDEVEEWILSTSGNFLSTDIYSCLHLSTREDKKNLSIILKRFCEREKPLIKRVQGRNGQWCRIEDDVEVIDWMNAPTEEYPVDFPLGISQLVKLYPGNIAVLAGASNAGKTSFMLELVRLNQKKHPVTYMNSEMGASELKIRLELFHEVCPLSEWNFRAIERSDNFADAIDPDGFNIIDFMEIYDEFWKLGGWIRDVHKKLGKGIAVIAIQKQANTKKGQNDFGRGGQLTIEKPRLYLAMDRGIIKIVKGKIWRNHAQNPNGLERRFKIVNGWKFLPEDQWSNEEEKKYDKYGFIHEG